MKFFYILSQQTAMPITRIKIPLTYNSKECFKITNILSAVSYGYTCLVHLEKPKLDPKSWSKIWPIRVEWLTFPKTRSAHPNITYHYQGWWFVVMWYQYSFRTIVAKEGNKEIFCLNTTYIFIHWNKTSYYVLVHALEVKIRTAISAKKLSA